MNTFTQLFGNNRLYACTAKPGDFLLVLPQPGPTSIPGVDAWTNPAYAGRLVYAATGAGVTPQNAEAYIARVLQVSGANRAMMWQQGDVFRYWTMDPYGQKTLTGLTVDVAPQLSYVVPGGIPLKYTEAAVLLLTTAAGYTGNHAPTVSGTPTQPQLVLDGANIGTLEFNANYLQESLNDKSSWGMQFVHSEGAHWFALAQPVPGKPLGFIVRFDPSLPRNQVDGLIRSQFGFDAGSQGVALYTYFRSSQGRPVELYPRPGSALVVHTGPPSRPVVLGPYGEFDIVINNGAPAGENFLCGLQGTEVIPLQNGYRIRFTPYQPAYAGGYPFPVDSPVAPPADPAAKLLTSTYTTSWAAVLTSINKTPYIAQPQGSAWYARISGSIYSAAGVYGWAAQQIAIPPGTNYPMAPYGASGAGAAAAFERQVIAPSRRQYIGIEPPYTESTATVTTPSGQLISVTNGVWMEILLGQTGAPVSTLAFKNPGPELRQAYLTSGLFLVAANSAYLGTFANKVEIGGWRLQANVGSGNAYADYRNIMIIKGRTGKLYDPDDPAGSLVSNPAQWTQSDFAIPTPKGQQGFTNAQRRELTIVSQWLQDYFADARDRGPDYDRFNAIAKDPNWTGTLFLRLDIDHVPDDLIGIMAGINDPAAFAAHHLAVELNPVAGNGTTPPSAPGTSSMFGVIDYRDSAFTRPEPGEAAEPIRPTAGTAFDFTLLSLQVVFANTAVRRFASLAQLVTASYFDSAVVRMGEGGNRYRAMLLSGTLQVNDGRPVYHMSSSSDMTFYLDNAILRKVEVTAVTMTTRDLGDDDDPNGSSWFGLTGYLDFAIVASGNDDKGENGSAGVFDVFSFGSPAGEDRPLTGLACSDLGILMTFPLADPAGRQFSFGATATRFDLAGSTARAGSLFRQFGLDVRGIVGGDANTPPSKNGYLPVTTDARLTGVDGAPWWGVQYQLAMGGAGHLAAQAGLTAQLLTAWSPRGPASPATGDQPGPGPDPQAGYPAAIGLQLPGTGGGAKLISIQSVLKLSLGQIWLHYDHSGDGGFLLLFSEIAIDVLGMLKLPPGSSLFYLYGNPHGGAAPSGLGWYAAYRREGIG